MLPLILGLSGPDLTDDERAFLREAAPAGFILFGRNVADPAQLRALTDELRTVTGRAIGPRRLQSADRRRAGGGGDQCDLPAIARPEA